MYTGPDALNKLIDCWNLGRPEYKWEIGQQFTAGGGSVVEITAKTADLAGNKHRAWYILKSETLVYEMSQVALQNGPWKVKED